MPSTARVMLVLLCSLSATAHAEDRESRARGRYEAGKQAFEAGQFQRAYDEFKSAYLISQSPALLYNLSSALQGLNQPHRAAEELRAYLRAVHDDPEAPQIEGRIRALEESQRLLDAEALKSQPPLLRPLPPAPPWHKQHRTALIVGGAVLAVAIGAAVGLGVGLQPPEFTTSTLSAHRATP